MLWDEQFSIGLIQNKSVSFCPNFWCRISGVIFIVVLAVRLYLSVCCM